MAKLKVIHINASLDIGGIETMIVQLCNHIDKDKFDVKFCSLSSNMTRVNEFDDSVESISLGFNPHSLRRLSLLFNFPRAVHRLGKLLKKENPNVIHIHSYFTIYLLVAIATRIYCREAKVVKTIHTSGLFYSSSLLIDRFRLWIEKRATSLNHTAIVGISEQVTDIAEKKLSGAATSINKIYNGVDISSFEDKPNTLLREKLLGNKKTLVTYVARIVDGKNHNFLIDIWNELKNQGFSSSRLIFIGGGEKLEHIRQKIASLNLTDDIVCFGQSSKVAEILKVSDFGVFPSDYEGFSLAMIEKMAAGLPVIASDIPPFREIITSGKNGIIIPLSDRDSWIKTIKLLSTKSSFRKSLSDAAIKRSKAFSIDIMTKGYESLYLNESRY